MDETTSGSHPGSYSSSGPTTGGPTGHGAEQGKHPASEARDLLQGGSPERVWRLADVKKLRGQVREAFEAGDPQEVWRLHKEVLEAMEGLVYREGMLRFKLMFGTTACTTCSGLRAGPGVTATCFQRKLCYFSNFKDTEVPTQTK